MTRTVILVPAFLLLLCVYFAGCTDSFGTPGPAITAPEPSPSPSPIPVTIPVTIRMTAPPVPTVELIQRLPAERQVNLVLTKDRPTSEIHLLYQGGPGEIYVNRIMMRVYSTMTEYREYIMSNGRKPIPGDEIVAPGTRQGDRCEVFVISAGTRYKVMDEDVYGGMYY